MGGLARSGGGGVDRSGRSGYIAPMATNKRSEEPITKAELRARKFMGARLQENEARYNEFIQSLEPRERERLMVKTGNE
jgi:hypothetical protein